MCLVTKISIFILHKLILNVKEVKEMKNMKKVCSVLLTISMVITMMTPIMAAHEVPIQDPGNQFDNIIGKILGFLQMIGYAFAVGMLLYLGIKYMMASANEKADLKKGSINYVIGAIIVVAASTLFGIIKNFATEME